MADAHHAGRLQAELVRLGRYPLLVIDPCRTWNYADRAPTVGSAILAAVGSARS
jgi:hypothetical protein